MARSFFLGGRKISTGGNFFVLGSDFAVGFNAGVPDDGTSGTGAGIAGPGSLCSDITNSKLYINTNTKASPTWVVVGTQT